MCVLCYSMPCYEAPPPPRLPLLGLAEPATTADEEVARASAAEHAGSSETHGAAGSSSAGAPPAKRSRA